MRLLDQPFAQSLAGARSVLLAGAGGGYDVFGAIPLIFDLLEAGKQVHLASLSFCYLNGLDKAAQDAACPNMYEIGPEAATPDSYCPEAWLARWLSEELGRRVSVFGFDKTGVRPLRAAYRSLVDRLQVDAIVLIDGGVDSLLRGDEISLGTPEEDLASLAAVRALDVPTKLLACIGLGAEIRDGICHSQVFERIAGLTREGAFLGTAALIGSSDAGMRYREAMKYVVTNQSEQRNSHVHKLVLASLRGDFGADGPHVWISPLLSIYWFFALDQVARGHAFLDAIEETESIWDVGAIVRARRASLAVRPGEQIPI